MQQLVISYLFLAVIQNMCSIVDTYSNYLCTHPVSRSLFQKDMNKKVVSVISQLELPTVDKLLANGIHR